MNISAADLAPACHGSINQDTMIRALKSDNEALHARVNKFQSQIDVARSEGVIVELDASAQAQRLYPYHYGITPFSCQCSYLKPASTL